jgi:hypothetical protein
MKKNLLFILFLGIIILGVKGQDLRLLSSEGIVITNKTIHVSGFASDKQINSSIWIQNESNIDKQIVVTQEVLQQSPGSNHIYFWKDETEENQTALKTLKTFKSGNINKEFITEFYPNNSIGNASVKYTFSNIKDPKDSFFIIVEYSISKGTLQDIPDYTLSEAYPNPAIHYSKLDYDIPRNTMESKIIIRSILGSIVKEYLLEGESGTLKIHTDNLSGGIYFYSLLIDDEIKITRKLVVKH